MTVLDEAMRYVWARGLEASGIVVEAEGSRLAHAIITEARFWAVDVAVMTAPPRRLLALGVWDKVTQMLARKAPCPVLVVCPRRPR
jgi:nucleotide-binding universal stress UspA family protein